MANVATLAGKVIATGIKWGSREGAWLAEMPGRVGTASFEGGHPPRGTIPAAALAASVIRPEHEFDPCLVALVCDDGENWLTVVMTDRAPSLLSEHEYSDAGSWKLAIKKALANASISRVYVPENSEVTVEDDNDKIVLFSQAELVAGAGIRPLRRRGRWRRLLAIGAAVAVTGSVLSLWVLFASNSNPPETATQTTPTEVTRLDVAALLRHCADALAQVSHA